MTTEVETPARAPAAAPSPPAWLRPLAAWQVLFAVAMAVLVVLIVMKRGVVIDGTPRLLAIAAFGLATLFAALSVPWLLGLHHRGRLAAFILNSLLAVGAGFIALQEMDIFNGLDAVGEKFPGALPFLALIAVGWLISGWSSRLGTSAAKALKLAARWLMIIGAGFMLLALGLLPGILEFLRRLVQPAALIPAAIAVLGAFWARLLWSDEATRAFGSTKAQMEVLEGVTFVAPNVLGFLAFLAGPLVISLFVSFTDWDGLGEASVIWFTNYTDLISDPFFLKSVRNILYFGILAVPLSVLPALGLAVLLNLKLPGMKIFRALYFLPAVAGVVGVALIWKQLYNATIGYINYAILRLTDFINLLPGVDFEAWQPQWLSSPSTAMISMVIVFSFSTIGLNTVLFLAGLQGLPPVLYEAAEIDGAGPWSKFRKITVPLLAPTTVFVVITTTILALQLFSEPFILNAPQLSPNGPDNATLTPVIYLYQNAFERFNQGYASAIGWVLFLLIFAITLIYFRTQRDKGVLST